MPNNRAYKVNRGRPKKTSGLIGVFLMLITAAVVALLIALIWQMSDNKNNSIGSENLQISQASPIVSDAAKASSSMPASSSEPESKPEPEPEKPIAGALPESERVNASYFDDAVFVGDSITEGMLYCIGMENARILAGTSINFSTIYTSEVIKLADGSRSTIMSELGKQPYKKVYVMMGGNEVRDQSKETFLERYGKLLDDVKAKQPDAIYYVQSMTPVTQYNNYNMDNKRIDEFNEAVMQLAHEKGMYYLDIASSMKNAQGMLPNEASPSDGMHFGQPYFDKWYAYLKTHVAPGSATEADLKKTSSASASSNASSTPASSAAEQSSSAS